MFQFFQKKKTATRWLFGLLMGFIGLSMVVMMVPGQGVSTGSRPQTVADVAGQEVTVADVQRTMQRMEAGGRNIPPQIRALYAKQVVDQLVFQHMLELEAKRLGVSVSQQEREDEIRRILPGTFAVDGGANFDTYAAEVQQRFQLGVVEFEELVRQSLLEQKVRGLVTDGLSVSPAEIEAEYRRKNEKVKLEYVVLKPSELEAQVPLTESDLASYFEKNKSKYQLPERRSVRYILVDKEQLRQAVKPSDAELRAYYEQNASRFQLQNRVHVSHILFSTVGKTDAEVEEIRNKAEGVLAKLKKGGKFEDLAKQYSDDAGTPGGQPGSKEKGGDLGWIGEKQTVPEFEKAAFGLAKGATSDLVKTQFGFHIIRVLERETARTLPFEEVRASILPIVAGANADVQVNAIGDKLAVAVRQSNRRPLEDLGKEFGLPVKELPPIAVTDPLGELGNSTEARDYIFRARPGELSPSLRTDRGYAVLTVKDIQPSRQAALTDVHAKVDADYRAEKSVEVVRKRAEELADKAKGGVKLAVAAKSAGLEAKTSELVSRTDSIPDIGTVRRLPQAFTLQAGGAAPAFFLGSNWVVYRVEDRQEAVPEDLAKQSKEIEQQLLQSKQQLAYEAFRAALKDRLKREGKLRMNEEALRQASGSL
jgi:peptidyl-prolyl cis-trans isomerase D